MSPGITLELTQSLFTNGARAAAILFTKACYLLAIPQLAKDIPGGKAGMNLGDSDVSLMLYRTTTTSDEFQEIQQLNVPGGEDAEFFTIDDRIFLATASMRSGSDPSYNMDVESCIFEWDGKKMNEFQCIPTFGAKQWRYFEIAGHHFLALAQGLVMPGIEPTLSMTNSTIFQWNGDKFESFQTVPSQMGYNWLHFSLDGRNFLAYADHIESSYILEWEDGQFVHFQTLDGANGRAFCFFEHNDRAFLAFARIASGSVVYKWDGKMFQQYQTLEGAGGREFTIIEQDNDLFLVQVKFITGDTADPDTALTSVIYRVDEDGLKVATEFPTFGGTDVTTFSLQDGTYLVVTESLTEEIRFRQDSHIYRVALESAPANTSITTAAKTPAHSKRQDSAFLSPEFLSLFQVYTSVNNSIGYDFKQAMVETQASNRLLLATATDFILYPGNGDDPTYLNHRFGTKGFIELTAVSHLSPAIATLVELRGLDPDSDTWKNHAKRLLNATRVAQKANSKSLWEDKIGVKSYEGREANIAAMVDYSCEMTIRLLKVVLDDPTKLTAKWVRDNYLEATNDALNAEIPMNYVMVATFFLSGLDTAYRIQESFEQYDIDWANAMVLVDGQMGRETAGVVIASNTIAQVLLRSPDALREFEPALRGLWGQLNGTSQLGEKMFSGYPAYKVPENTFPAITSTTEFVSGFPAINGPDDWLALTTRLRVALEDIRQSVSASVTDYAAQQLYETGRNLSEIVVPGLDGYDYASAVAQGSANKLPQPYQAMKRNNTGAPVMMVVRPARPPLSCRSCREKKRRCDRNQPCSNCSQRGVACEYAERDPFVESDSANLLGGSSQADSTPSTTLSELSLTSSEVLDRILGTPFNFHSANTIPVNSFPHAAWVAHLVAQLPPIDQARQLFEHFTATLHRSLCVLHIPSTRALMERTYELALSGTGDPGLEDILMLFGIFAGAALYWTNNLVQTLNSTKENAKSAFETYTHLAMSILDNAHRPLTPSTTALTAVATLAHIVLNSEDSFPTKALTLRIRCLLMARAMLLHRLDTPTSRKERRLKGENTIEIEVQRRVWWSMVASDWLGAFSGSPQEGVYTFVPRHMNVRYPCNIDDDSISPSEPIPALPLATPTDMSCFLQRLKMADLCREIVDTIPPIINEFPEPDFDVILGLDKKLQDLHKSLPDFFQLDPLNMQQTQSVCQQRPYIVWQRITVHFSLHARICRLHRPYHLEARLNPKYSYSRTATIHSAYKILELRRMMDEASAFSSFRPERYWVILQHVTMAALTLATDVSFNPDAPDAEARKEKVLAAYGTLERSKNLSNGSLEGIEKNMQNLMATLQNQPEKSTLEGASSSIASQMSNVGTVPDQEFTPKFSDVAMSEPVGGEYSHQLWSDFLAAVPALEDVQWTSLLQDLDLDFTGSF
ncbi:hypothetical protein NM208_g2123 [Fusarium decemcellulare]|uniref:Uncharacterized protein n=1 Tax=Fusarium decemcellulare TaxID=57161 RepID=A0ACC1STW8_9HYPO|nr:hypothetical protein NM208_g2123 [Fusarium decemcellulare]